MSNVFTLDSLREEAENKLAPVKIVLSDKSEVELKSLLRLGKKTRDMVGDILEDMQAIGEDAEDDDDLESAGSELMVESISKLFSLIASRPEKLLAELDHSDPMVKVTLMSSVLNKWVGGSQLGEAGNSPA